VDTGAVSIRIGGIEQMTGNVVICGTFDLYHAGHAAALKYAKSLGDHLIVLLYDDDYSERLKGRRPIHPLEFRMAVLESVRWVDRIMVVKENLPFLVGEIRPDVLIDNRVNSDLPNLVVNAKDVVEEYDGMVIACPIVASIESADKPLSSSSIKHLIYAEAGLICGE